MKWLDSKQIQITPPKRTKKVTGTRFATILGLNPWSTPFEMWCAITKTYEKPFEDTIYTIAGKTIEPKRRVYEEVLRYGLDYSHRPLRAGLLQQDLGRFLPGEPPLRQACGTTSVWTRTARWTPYSK